MGQKLGRGLRLRLSLRVRLEGRMGLWVDVRLMVGLSLGLST